MAGRSGASRFDSCCRSGLLRNLLLEALLMGMKDVDVAARAMRVEYG